MLKLTLEFENEAALSEYLAQRNGAAPSVAEVLGKAKDSPAQTQKDLIAVITSSKDAKGIDAIAAVLAEHGAKKVSELEPGHIGSVMAAIKGLPDA